MPDYEKMYYNLFNSVTDAIEILNKAQRKSEETYLISCEEEAQKRKKAKNKIVK